MNALTRLDRLESMIPELMRRWARPMQFFDEVEMPSGSRIDITENDKEFLVTADLPGARKDDVRVSVDGSYVAISADVKRDEEKQGRAVITEIYRGAMSRAFNLGSEVDEKTATAKMENGVLRLTLPKRTGEAGSKLLNIQ